MVQQYSRFDNLDAGRPVTTSGGGGRGGGDEASDGCLGPRGNGKKTPAHPSPRCVRSCATLSERVLRTSSRRVDRPHIPSIGSTKPLGRPSLLLRLLCCCCCHVRILQGLWGAGSILIPRGPGSAGGLQGWLSSPCRRRAGRSGGDKAAAATNRCGGGKALHQSLSILLCCVATRTYEHMAHP